METQTDWLRYTQPAIGVTFSIATGDTKKTILEECAKQPVYNNSYTNNNNYGYKKSWINVNPTHKGRTLIIPFDVACTYGIAQSMSGTSEIGGLGVIDIDGDNIILKKIFCCYDERNSSGSHFSNPAELSRVMIEARKRGYASSSLKAFWHSHPNFHNAPSVIDHDAIVKIIDENPKAEVYSIIFSNMRQVSCRYDSKATGEYQSELLDVDILYPEGETAIVIDNPAALKAGTDKYLAPVNYGGYHRFRSLYDNDDEVDTWFQKQNQKKSVTSTSASVKKTLLSGVEDRLERYEEFFTVDAEGVIALYNQLTIDGEVINRACTLLDNALSTLKVRATITPIFIGIDSAFTTKNDLTYFQAQKYLEDLKRMVNRVNELKFHFVGSELLLLDDFDDDVQTIAKLIASISASVI